MRASSLAVATMLCALSGSALTGCTIVRASGRALGSLFETPRKVEHKVTTAVEKNARLAVIWVGHATVLVQIDDKLVLTDPVFTSTVGQISKRLVEPGLDPAILPPLDAVLISHMHFDHLSLGTLAGLEPKIRTILMPRGGVSYLTDFRFPAVELRTWQAWEKDGLRITAVPVDHVGHRYGLDDAWSNEAFTGYVIEYHGMKVYFGGDTAYDQKLFVETGQRFPGIDVALLPIGPIEPRDIMRRFHTDPGEALQAFFDLGAKHMVPIHYDTFVNSTDHVGDALRELKAAEKKWDLEGRDVAVLAVGERRVFLQKGEGPQAPEKAKEATEGSWSTPSSQQGAPSRAAAIVAPVSTVKKPEPEKKPETKPEKKPEKKNDIPDDERLD